MQAKTDFLHRTGPVRIVMLFAISAGFLATIFAADTALAQEAYPTHPISLIAPYSVGGDADLAARNFAVAAQLALGQPVVVLNKTGASGILGSAYAIASPPDGYTLLLARTGSQAILRRFSPTRRVTNGINTPSCPRLSSIRTDASSIPVRSITHSKISLTRSGPKESP